MHLRLELAVVLSCFLPPASSRPGLPDLDLDLPTFLGFLARVPLAGTRSNATVRYDRQVPLVSARWATQRNAWSRGWRYLKRPLLGDRPRRGGHQESHTYYWTQPITHSEERRKSSQIKSW